ncbi:CPBP family intramembrane glutamic endopeptidase [Kocuria arenosa]|uniref:CPBP family intramembrane glutamic endopeptidase n=1 Tax=Kocuria arenosa TaxID=3071446 RepID=UPI0034D77CFD
MSAAPMREGSSANPPDGGALVRFIRRRPLVSFLLWAYTLGQVLPWLVVLTGLADRDRWMQGSVLVSTLIGLLMPALLITRTTDGRDGLRALWRRAVAVRVGPVWHAAALILVPALTLTIGVLIVGTSAEQSAGFLLTGLGTQFLLPLLITFVLINWWEGVAWTGFVQARLQDRHGALLAALTVAPLFALRYSPLVAGHGVMAGAAMLVLLAALAVPFRFALGWSYNRTGSLFLVGLLHAAGNPTAGGDGFNAGYLRDLYPHDTNVTMAHLMAKFLLGLLVVIATRGRLGHRRPGGPPAKHLEGTGSATPGTVEES